MTKASPKKATTKKAAAKTAAPAKTAPTATPTLHARLVALVKDLKACPAIDVGPTKLGRERTAAATRQNMEGWSETFQTVDPEMVRFSPSEPIFMHYTGGMDGHTPLGGEFRLVSPGVTIHRGGDNGLAWEGITDEQRAVVDHLRIFDSHPTSGDYKCGTFLVPPHSTGKRPMPDIYLFDRGEFFKMAVDYAGYIRGMIDCAAVGGWQYLYLSDPTTERWLLERLRDNLACLQKLMPQRDWSGFAGRLEALGA